MTDAFQLDAFQADAVQVDPAFAFQQNAFQTDAFQTEPASSVEAVKPPKAETGGAVIGRAGSGRWARIDDDTIYLGAKPARAAARSRSRRLDLAPALVARTASAHARTATATVEVAIPLGAGPAEAYLEVTLSAGPLPLIQPLASPGSVTRLRGRQKRVKLQTNDIVEVLRIIEMLTAKKAA